MELFEAVTDLETALSGMDQNLYTTYNWSNFARILSNVRIIHNHQELALISDHLVTKLATSQIFIQELINKLDKRMSSNSSEKGSNWLDGLKIVLDKLDTQHRQRRILENLIMNLTSCNYEPNEKKKKKKPFQLSILMDKVLKEESKIIPLDVHAVFKDVDDYLEVHKNLIVEDFFRPLRQSVKKIMTEKSSSQSGAYSYGSGQFYLSSSGFVVNIEDQNHIDWASTSRLMPGSLVILRHAFDTNMPLSFWILKERELINTDRPGGRYLSIALTSVQENFKPLNTDQVEVFESVVYFEAYVHVIRALHTLAGKIPFEDQIVRLNSDLKIKCVQALSIHQRHQLVVQDEDIFDSAQLWSLLNDANAEQHAKEPLDFQSLNKVCNPSQMAAIRMGLEHSIGLIQGPPGTGKSYVGTLLAKILMANTVKPIVVVCYTNHSLDTFLESLIRHTAKIVRIGGRSKSQRLEPFNLGNIKRHMKHTMTRNSKIYKAIKALEEKLTSNPEQYHTIFRRIQEWNNLESLQIVNKAKIVGMTSTGAAKNFCLLRLLDPEILMIEEAGQVLESHILASLTPNLKQLVLIGDHQQLKPAVATYELALKYRLDLSLFERLIRNGFPFTQLKEQHRMRPEIADILRCQFYPDLKDHQSVASYPKIKGVTKDVFFLNHGESEETLRETSKINKSEAQFLIQLALYLVKQGYEAAKISLLATYLGQTMYLEHLVKMTGNEVLRNVVIAVVDNYQGEENDIILLSLVRSNEAGNIGYLRLHNRICVALSRARHGLFVVGNFKELSASSKSWKNILHHLEKKQQVGFEMELQCIFHPTSRTLISLKSIFDTPFCQSKCGAQLSCGEHLCETICHFDDRAHQTIHKCPIKRKKLLNCGHEKSFICGDDQGFLSCDYQCDFTLPCGHPCQLPCHLESAPKDHNPKCAKPCERKVKSCFFQSHNCPKSCGEKCNTRCLKIIPEYRIPKCGHNLENVTCADLIDHACMVKCKKILTCGTHRCKNYCYECQENGGCQPCKVVIDWTLDCGHLVKISCDQGRNSSRHCYEKCQRLLKCGHSCPLLCHQSCDTALCQLCVDEVDLEKNDQKMQQSDLLSEEKCPTVKMEEDKNLDVLDDFFAKKDKKKKGKKK